MTRAPMRYLLLFLSTLMLLPFQTAASPDKIVKDIIVSQGRKRALYLFVPETIKSGTPAPLIVLLHGSGRNGFSLVDKWKDLAEKEGIILAGPDSTDPAKWATPVDGPDFLRDVVENVKSKYSINPRRVYLFGHSAGAVFALYMALFESEYFAASVAHAGALRPNDAAIEIARRKTPIAIFVGTRDSFFPLADVRGTRDDLNKQGFAAELTELPGHDHNYYAVASKINNSAWEFLKKHELKEDPQYQQYRWNQ